MLVHHGNAFFSRCRTALAIIAIVSAASSQAQAPAAAPIGTPAQPFRAPFVPAADAEVLQEVPAASDPSVGAIRALRTQLDASPANLEIADELARAYIRFGRQLGDAHYVGYAEAVIAPWLTQRTPPVATLVIYATILQYRHQFALAREQLDRALKLDPSDAQAWLTLATLDMVQGEYPAATRGCEQAASHGGLVVGVACTANLRSYLGQARQSVAMLTTIGMRAGRLPATYAAWIEGLLAESEERLGNWPQVEAHYRKALSYEPNDNFLLVAYADFLLDRGRPKEVLTLLAKSAQSDTAFLRLVLAQAALRSPDLPRYVWVMSARFEALAQRGDDLFGREQVRFALHAQHDPQTALDLAQQNWKVQRAPWDARVFLEAALAANQPKAALPVLEFLDRTKLEDPIIEPLARELRGRIAKPLAGDAR